MRKLLAAILAAFGTVACSDLAEPAPPPSLAPNFTVNLSWLTTERQERLADAVETLRIEHGWVVG